MWFLDKGGGSALIANFRHFFRASACPAESIFKSVPGIEFEIWPRGKHSQSLYVPAGRVGVWRLEFREKGRLLSPVGVGVGTHSGILCWPRLFLLFE